MNARIKEIAVQANLIGSEPNGFDRCVLSTAEQTFAELIIAECTAAPLVYLLSELSMTDSDACWRLRGWTSDLKVAHQWRTSSGRGLNRNFESLSFVKKVDRL